MSINRPRESNSGRAKPAIEVITDHVDAGNEGRLTGFGKFSAVHRAAREGRIPQTGASMQIAAKSVPKFSAGAELKKAVE